MVQGPPGTGKTHTIANLVSALLAQGQRVLVTSARDQPLTVLRDELPQPVRDLCVLLLSSTRHEGEGELELTINALTDQVAASDPAELRAEIRRLAASGTRRPARAVPASRGRTAEQRRCSRGEPREFLLPEVAGPRREGHPGR
ncbi:AAA domain-containing protein [Streptomyces sp. NPDC058665]|uniref:AAA domain-containing protein n=1 Tax=Streptomyces sp. NPDC058665 TaxID=3346586 RepID=UPI0036589694